MAAGAAGACPGYRDGLLIPVIQISGSGESKASSPRPVCQPASQPQVAPARGMRAPRCEIFPGVALASSLWPLLPVKRRGSEGQTPSVRSGF